MMFMAGIFALGALAVFATLYPPKMKINSPGSEIWAALIRYAAAGGILWFMWVRVGWPVAGLVLGGMLAALPKFRSKKAAADSRAQGEAVAEWVTSIQQHIESGRQLNEAVRLASETPPTAIAHHIAPVAEGMMFRPLRDSLRDISDRLSHPVSDMAVASLLTAERRGGGQLAELLRQLADSLRLEVDLYEEMSAKQAGVRLDTGMLLVINFLVAAGIPIMNPALVEGYRGTVGQVVLGVFMASFAGVIFWIRSLSRIATGERFQMRWEAL